MKAVMYHYVRPFQPHLPHLKKLDLDDFRRQLDHFESEYGFISHEEFIYNIRNRKVSPGVILTFDDGLKCHYDFVYPELKARGLWGIFYLATQIYELEKMLDVHRIHLLLAINKSSTVRDALMDHLTEDLLKDHLKKEFRELTYTRQENDSPTVFVKRVLNYFIDYSYREQVINTLTSELIPEDLMNVDQFYITINECREMHDGGMIIGSHTVTHPVLAKLPKSLQEKEIINSFRLIEEVCSDLPVKTFCFPYGGFHSFTQETIEILEEENCDFSFNVEQRDITVEDLAGARQYLPRYDCNQFPYGKVR